MSVKKFGKLIQNVKKPEAKPEPKKPEQPIIKKAYSGAHGDKISGLNITIQSLKKSGYLNSDIEILRLEKLIENFENGKDEENEL